MYSIGIDTQSRVKKMINEARYYSRYQIFLVVPLGQEPDPVNRYKLCLWLKAVALNFVITFTTPFCKKTVMGSPMWNDIGLLKCFYVVEMEYVGVLDQ